MLCSLLSPSLSEKKEFTKESEFKNKNKKKPFIYQYPFGSKEEKKNRRQSRERERRDELSEYKRWENKVERTWTFCRGWVTTVSTHTDNNDSSSSRRGEKTNNNSLEWNEQ